MVNAVLNGQDESDELDLYLKDSTYETIVSEYVIPRGKAYALNLLSARDYSRSGLISKLAEKGYSQKYIDIVIAYVDSFKYLDDVKFASNYIRQKQNTKSPRTIKEELKRKGISDNDYELALAQVEEEACLSGTSLNDIKINSIKAIIERKLRGDEFLDKEKVTKVISSLLRKGYEYSDIKLCLDGYNLR